MNSTKERLCYQLCSTKIWLNEYHCNDGAYWVWVFTRNTQTTLISLETSLYKLYICTNCFFYSEILIKWCEVWMNSSVPLHRRIRQYEYILQGQVVETSILSVCITKCVSLRQRRHAMAGMWDATDTRQTAGSPGRLVWCSHKRLMQKPFPRLYVHTEYEWVYAYVRTAEAQRK